MGVYFGFRGDLVAAKKHLEATEKNFGILGALKKKRGGGDDEEKGEDELVANPMAEGEGDEEVGNPVRGGDIELKSMSKKKGKEREKKG